MYFFTWVFFGETFINGLWITHLHLFAFVFLSTQSAEAIAVCSSSAHLDDKLDMKLSTLHFIYRIVFNVKIALEPGNIC